MTNVIRLGPAAPPLEWHVETAGERVRWDVLHWAHTPEGTYIISLTSPYNSGPFYCEVRLKPEGDDSIPIGLTSTVEDGKRMAERFYRLGRVMDEAS